MFQDEVICPLVAECSIMYIFSRDGSSRFDSCCNTCLCFRNYAIRRVRDAFRTNKMVSDPTTVERLITEGQQSLGLIQRQVGHTQAAMFNQWQFDLMLLMGDVDSLFSERCVCLCVLFSLLLTDYQNTHFTNKAGTLCFILTTSKDPRTWCSFRVKAGFGQPGGGTRIIVFSIRWISLLCSIEVVNTQKHRHTPPFGYVLFVTLL